LVLGALGAEIHDGVEIIIIILFRRRETENRNSVRNLSALSIWRGRFSPFFLTGQLEIG
jgi:hypothetical protein